MLDYGINFNTEEGVKKALKEIEEAGKKWQAVLDKRPLKLDFSSDDKGFKKTESNIKGIGAQLTELRRMFRNLEIGDNLESEGRAIIDLFKELKSEAGEYGNSLDSVVKKEQAASSDSLTVKLKQLSDRWKELSIAQRKGSEGLSLILQFNNLSKEADQYAGSLSKVAALHNASIQAKTVSQELAELTSRWDALSIAQRQGAEGRVVIDAFKAMTNAAGVYIGSIRDVIAEEERLSKTDPLRSRLSQLESQWESLSIDKRRGQEGRVILDNYRQIQESAGVYLGSIKEVLAEEKRIAEETQRKTKEVEKQNSAYKRQSEVLTQLKSYAMNILSVYGGIRLTKNLIGITGEFESQRVALKSILMDAQKGEAIFERIKSLAVVSPFEVKDLVAYTKQLSAFSVPYEELYDTTKMLADVSSGLGVDMSRIILAYGQVRSAAVLRGQELRQFTEAGIPLVDELAKKFTELKGEIVSASEVFDLISQRQVPFQMIKDIFTEMTSEGGKFYKMQEKQAETLKGKVSNLTDAFHIMLSEIGEKGSGVLKGSIDSTRWLMENYDAIGRILLTLVATYGYYKTAIIAATAWEAARNKTLFSQIKTLRLVAAAQALWNKTILAHPYVAITAAVVGLTAAVISYNKSINATKKAQEALNRDNERRSELYEKEREEIRKNLDIIKDDVSTRLQKQQALSRLQSMMPSIFSDLDIEKARVLGVTEAYRLYNEQLDRRTKSDIQGNIKRAQEIISAMGDTGTLAGSPELAKEVREMLGLSGLEYAIAAPFAKIRPMLEEYIRKQKGELIKINQEEYNSLPAEKKLSILKSQLDVLEKIYGITEGSNIDLLPENIRTEYVSLTNQIDVLNASMKVNKVLFDDLLKEYQSAKDTLSGLQQSFRIGEATEDQVDEASARVEELKKKLEKMGWNEPKPGDANKAKKEAEKRTKEYLDAIQSQVDEYKKKFDIWNTIYEGSGKKPAMDFDITFNGEPDVSKYIKSKMQEVGGGKLNLDIDFLTADFSDILGGATFDEQTKKVLQDMFSELRGMYFNERKELQDLYDKYATYIIKKQKLDQSYQKERRKMIADGAEKAILDEQFKIYTEASNKLATEFAEQDLEFNRFVNELADKSIEELGRLLMQIDLEMAKMIESGGDPETIAVLRAKVAELEKLLRSKTGKSEKEDKPKDSYKDWKRLQTMLSRVDKELQDIGDNIGGTAGEMVKFAGGLTSSTLKMVNSIVELSEQGILGIKMSATTAASAIKALESASVILAVISAAIQVFNAIKGLFDNKEQREYINKLEEDRNEIAREYNRILLERIAIEDNLFGGNNMQNLVNVINGYSAAVKKIDELLSKDAKVRDFYAPGRYIDTITSARGSLRIKTKTANWFQKNVLGQVDKYENLEDWVKKNLGVDLFNENGWLNLDVAKDVAGLEQIDSGTREILESLISVQEAAEEFEETISEMIDDVFGELGDSLTNAIVEGFRNGSLAAEDFKDDITAVLEDVAAQMVRMLFLQQYIDKYKASLKDIYEDYAVSGDKEAFMKKMMDATADFYGSASKAWGDASNFMTMFQEEGKKHGFNLFSPDNESNLTGISKAVAGMSEDAALIFGGYLNSIRDKMFPYIDYMMTEHRTTMSDMLNVQRSMVAYLVSIAANTLRSADSNDRIENLIKSVISPKGSDSATNGINIQ